VSNLPEPIPCRRKEDPLLILLNSLTNDVSLLRQELKDLASIRPHLDEHIRQEGIFQNKLLTMATEAFSDGDPVAHRLEHEARRERARFCKAFWENLLTELGKKTVFALIAVAGAILAYWISGHYVTFTNVPPK